MSAAELAASILSALPQTQCTRCGFTDCSGYAKAIAHGQAGINQCPTGGAQGVELLASLTGQPVLPINPLYGAEGPRSVACVDESGCIGCALCLKACPVDAILGARQRMHTVIESWCTGCGLCLQVCPMDCIALENVSDHATGWQAWSKAQADQAREHYEFNSYRRKRDGRLKDKRHVEISPLNLTDQSAATVILDAKQSMIEAALERSRAKRHAGQPNALI